MAVVGLDLNLEPNSFKNSAMRLGHFGLLGLLAQGAQPIQQFIDTDALCS
jgi:hypothetical protein